MEGQPESIKVIKHQQHLKLQKQIEDESWISGEELRTEGSSDEESTRRNKMNKVRRKSKDKRNASTQNPKNSEKCEASSSFPSTSQEDNASCPLSWKPKRGSLKLPNLFEDHRDCPPRFTPLELTDFLPVLKLDRRERNKRAEIAETLAAIDHLEKRIKDNANILQNETNERLKAQEEMCEEISNSGDFLDGDASEFISRHRTDNFHVEFEKHDNPRDINCRTNADHSALINKSNTKDFINRNIELASTAMLKLPLTDEEKQHLDQILSDIDLCDFEGADDTDPDCEATATAGNNDEENDPIENSENGFHFSKGHEKRMREIDFQLDNNFDETQHLKSAKNKADNFWKSLILEQMLKDVDAKLESIEKSDVTKRN